MPTITADRTCCAASLITAFEMTGARAGWKTAWPDRTTRRGSNNCPVVRITPVFKPVNKSGSAAWVARGFLDANCSWYARRHIEFKPMVPVGQGCETQNCQTWWAKDEYFSDPCVAAVSVITNGCSWWIDGCWETVSDSEARAIYYPSDPCYGGQLAAIEVLSEPVHLGGPSFWNNVCGGSWSPPPELSVDLTSGDWGSDPAYLEWLSYDAIGCNARNPVGVRRDSRLAFKVTVDAPACALAGRMGKVSLVLRVTYQTGGVEYVDGVVRFTGAQAVDTVTLPAVEVDLDAGGTYITDTLAFAPSAGQGVRLANWWG